MAALQSTIPIYRITPSPGDAPDEEQYTVLRELHASAARVFDNVPPKIFDRVIAQADPYSDFKHLMRRGSCMNVCTNATLKMHELMSYIDVGPVANVFCNAELPGSFAILINHHMRGKYPLTPFKWVANSFIQDRRSSILYDTYGVLQCNPRNWLPCAEMNGDIMQMANIQQIAASVHARFADTGGATLYTSDAGVDIGTDYEHQEELNADVNFYQIMCGLLTTAVGGTMLFKQYTFFTKLSRSFLAYIHPMFDTIDIVKPKTSRPGNSEIYVICKGYHGVPDNIMDVIAQYANIPIIAIDPMLDATLFEILTHLVSTQVTHLNRVYESYLTPNATNRVDRKLAWETWYLSNPMIRAGWLINLATTKSKGINYKSSKNTR
jgi:hypothetical protein